MPTYEYVCEKCDHRFDVFQSMTEKSLLQCPKDKCGQKKWGKGKVKRGIGGGSGLIFKGSGFYITDYRSDSYKAAAKSDSASSTPPSPTKSAGDGGKGSSPTPSTPASSTPATPAKSTASPSPTSNKSDSKK